MAKPSHKRAAHDEGVRRSSVRRINHTSINKKWHIVFSPAEPGLYTGGYRRRQRGKAGRLRGSAGSRAAGRRSHNPRPLLAELSRGRQLLYWSPPSSDKRRGTIATCGTIVGQFHDSVSSALDVLDRLPHVYHVSYLSLSCLPANIFVCCFSRCYPAAKNRS